MKKLTRLLLDRRFGTGRQVLEIFDKNYYCTTYPDVKKWRKGALNHFLEHGAREGRSPNLLFDSEWYLRMNPDLPEGTNPALHYISHGEQEGRWPHPLFNPRWYLEVNSDVASASVPALQHFLTHGLKEGREFSPLFSVRWYKEAYPDCATFSEHPVLHFLLEGGQLGLDPGPHFSSRWYLEDNPDVRSAGMHPYLHFLKYGQYEGRLPLPHFYPGASHFDRAEEETFDLSTFASITDEKDCEPGGGQFSCELDLDTRGYKLASFDVWSTLLHRQCSPDEIKLQSARYLLFAASDNLKPAFSDLSNLYAARIRAENKSAPHGDFEYRFADAIDLWLAETLHPSTTSRKVTALREGLLKHEFDAELRATHRDTATADFIRRLDLPYVFASDFYMPSDFIRRLLNAHDVGGQWARGYSSCDTFENKRTGKLFQTILSDFHIEAGQLLHIGDNPEADGIVPRSIGVATQAYECVAETKRMHWYGEAFGSLLSGDSNLHHRRLLAMLEEVAQERNRTVDVGSEKELFMIGVRIAPIVFSFCLSVLEEAIKSGVDRVFFFTREGLFFKEVYDALVDNDPYNMRYPASAIVEVSRRATFAASLNKFEATELMRLWSMYSQQSPQGFASSLNLDQGVVQRVAEKYGLPFHKKVVHPWNDEAFQRFMGDEELSMVARESMARQRRMLQGYLEQVGFARDQDGPLTIVDIGWRGTIQDNLAKLVRPPLRGHYLALFKFLNAQEAFDRKTGWLGDDNVDAQPSIPDQVAPLEMIFNGRGGSVVGYELKEGHYRAIKEVTPGEEAVVESLRPLQEGMLTAISHLARYVRLHGLTAEHLRPTARKLAVSLIVNPPHLIADLFSRLSHNETFGTGHIDNVGGDGTLSALKSANSPQEVHYTLDRWLDSVRWKEGAARQTLISDWWKGAPQTLKSAAPLAIAKIYSPAVVEVVGERLAVYAPAALRASGGHRTIFNMTRRLAELGFQPYIFTDGIGDGVRVVEEYLAGTSARIHTNWRHPVSSKVAFATIAHSAKFVRDNVHASYKFYLVQDAEALFNPVGDAYAMAEDSYAQGLNHVTIGNWLTHLVRNQYHANANPAGLGVDTDIYKRVSGDTRENAICMLYQPEKPRRGNSLALAALKLVKQSNPDVKIYLYGSDRRVETDFDAEQLGVISQLSELNSLYNRCRAGICISLSNPSRIPFEMMAAGCIPVDVYRYNNLLDYDDDTAILAYQNAESIALALNLALKKNEQVAASLDLARVAARRTLRWENDAIVGHVLGTLAGAREVDGTKLRRLYAGAPVIAPGADIAGAEAFCRWQAKLADM